MARVQDTQGYTTQDDHKVCQHQSMTLQQQHSGHSQRLQATAGGGYHTLNSTSHTAIVLTKHTRTNPHVAPAPSTGALATLNSHLFHNTTHQFTSTPHNKHTTLSPAQCTSQMASTSLHKRHEHTTKTSSKQTTHT